MGTVVLFSADRMQDIEDATVTSMAVNGAGHLIVTRHDESTFDAGDVSVWLPGRLSASNNVGSGVDPDTLLSNGWYAGTGWIGSLAGYTFGVVEVLSYDASYKVQNFWLAGATPRRFNRALVAGAWTAWTEPDAVISASTAVRGQVFLASNAETTTGVDGNKAVTPAGLASVKATNAEVLAGVSTKLVTPVGLKSAMDSGMFDTRYYTESEINGLITNNAFVGIRRVIPPTVAKAGTGTVVVDSDGTVRVSVGGPTAISLNDIFQTGKNYEIDIVGITSADGNNAFRFRKAGVDLSGASDYVWGAFYDTLTWIGSQAGSGYSAVSNTVLLSVNGKTNHWSKIFILNRHNTSSQYFHFISNSRAGSQQTIWSGSGDTGGTTQTGFTLIVGAGSFSADTQIKVWELQ